MKKISALFLALMLVLTVACGSTPPTESDSASEAPSSAPTQVTPTPSEDAFLSEESTPPVPVEIALLSMLLPESALVIESSENRLTATVSVGESAQFVIFVQTRGETTASNDDILNVKDELFDIHKKNYGATKYEICDTVNIGVLDALRFVFMSDESTGNLRVVDLSFIYGGLLYQLTFAANSEYGELVDSYTEDIISTIVLAELSPEPTSLPTLTYGDTFEFDGFEITFINELKWAVVSNRFSEHNESDVCGITVIIKNIGSETNSLSTFECTLFGSKGTQLDKVSSYFNDDVFKIGDMRSGAEGSGYMHFLYDGDGDYYVEFGSRNDKIEVKLPVVK